MQAVLMEMRYPDHTWARVGSIGEVEPVASFKSESVDQRRVFLFGWLDGKPGVWESKAGLDVETEAVRALDSLGIEQLSDLAEPFHLKITRGVTRVILRFTLTEEVLT